MRNKTSPETWQPRDQTPVFDHARYPAALLARVAGTWRRLCQEERESLIAATLVTTDLARLGAPPAILGMAARVIEDEVRHVEVCTRVLESLGKRLGTDLRAGAGVAEGVPDSGDKGLEGFGQTPGPAPARVTRPGRAETVESRAARCLIARFAVGETLSAACFATARATAREPIIAWGYTELLRDEARHGTFGARAGAWVIRDWSPERRQALWPDCVQEMESFERRVGGPVMASARTPHRRDTAADALGLLAPESSCSAVITSIPRWVLPHLVSLGVVPPSPSESTVLLQ